MSPRIVDKSEKRTQIALAAVDVFGRQGFDRTKMDDVAAAAGVGKGTLYEYFRDKEELMRGAFDALLASFSEELHALPASAVAPLDRLQELCHATQKAMLGMGHTYRFFLEYLLHASRVEGGTEPLAELLSHFRQGIAWLLREAQVDGSLRGDFDADLAAAALAAWFDGAWFHWMVMPETTDLDQLTSHYLDALLVGLRPRHKENEATQ